MSIGTSVSSARLDVNGSINISGSGASVIFPDASTQTISAMSLIEIWESLRTAYLVYDGTNDSINVTFPYVFSDGNQWGDVNIATTTSGKSGGVVYWLGIYYNGTKTYSSTSGPTSSDIFYNWSASNTVEPIRPTDGVKIESSLRGTGDTGGDADITDFTWSPVTGVNLLAELVIGSQTATSFTSLNSVLVDWVPPNAREVMFTVVLNSITSQTIASAYISAEAIALSKDLLYYSWSTSGTGREIDIQGTYAMKTSQTLWYKVSTDDRIYLYMKAYK